MSSDPATENPKFRDHYQALGVDRNGSFTQLKKAYFKRAKECHPDLHPNDPRAEAEFRLLVAAFDVLSDPDKRRQYDAHLQGLAAGERATRYVYRQIGNHSIMDSFADDILEELIVGNVIPEDAALQTLLLDLENTENFIRFREAKTCYADAEYHKALRILETACRSSPENILYHYYYAQTAERLHKWSLADKQYRRCLRIGELRSPPQRLVYIRECLQQVRQKHRGILGRVRNWFAGDPPPDPRSAEERMVEETSRAMTRLLAQGRKPAVKKPPPKQLPPAAGR